MMLFRSCSRLLGSVGLALLLLIGAGLHARLGARVSADPGPAVTPTATIIGTNRLTLAAQIGGANRAVAVAGTRLIFSQGRRFEVADLSDPAVPVSIGVSPLLAADVAELALAGQRAFVAVEDAALLAFDLSDPAEPRQTASLKLPGPAVDLALDGARAYVAIWGYGLGVVDLETPDHLRLLGVVPTGVQPEAVAIADGVIYLLDSMTGLSLLRPVEAALPQVLATVTGDRSADGLAAVGRYAYIAGWAGGLGIVDAHDPTTPQIIRGVALPGIPRAVAVADGYAYVAADDRGLRVVDVRNPAQATLVGSYDTNLNATNVAVVTGHVLVADYLRGVHVLDISRPAAPALVGVLPTIGGCRDVALVGEYVLVTDPAKALHSIDVRNPYRPQVVDSLVLPSWGPLGMAVAGDYAYVAAYEQGLRVVSIADPRHLREVGVYAPPRHAFLDVVVGNGYAYVLDMHAGVRVFDLSTPTAPREVGLFGQGNAQDLALARRYLAVAMLDIVVIYDLAEPVDPVAVGAYYLPQGVGAIKVAFDGARLYIADWMAQLYILDASDLSRITLLGRAQLPGYPQRLVLIDDALYVGMGGGLLVMDIADPAQPQPLASYGPIGDVNGIAVVGDTVYLADGRYGFWILSWLAGDERQFLPVVR
jgi:hypothetical protein